MAVSRQQDLAALCERSKRLYRDLVVIFKEVGIVEGISECLGDITLNQAVININSSPYPCTRLLIWHLYCIILQAMMLAFT